MRLFIAEKPSLGRAIAEGLSKGQGSAGQGSAGQKGNGLIRCGNDIVTWCFGHLLELFAPDDYDPAYKAWSRSGLPIVPQRWQLKAVAKSADQLALIGNLLRDASSVVNAGDPDREGQLLVDEVLEHFKYSGPVARIWLASLDARSVEKALATLTDNTQYAPLRDAARARSQADWLVGLNATRAMTILGRESGRDGVLSLGRVQTPTLALVVGRDREIEAFRPQTYFTLHAQVAHTVGNFMATFTPHDTQAGLDPDGRLIDQAVANEIARSMHNQAGRIQEVTREKKKKAVPLPHSLSSLQKMASAKLGMTAQEVLSTAQSLYEKKLTTYPRTDCRYLPDEQFADAARILTALGKVSDLAQAALGADSSLRGPVWDTKKITAHHAIIPTGELPAGMTRHEQAVYTMIALAYCLQFYPPMQYEAQKITVTLGSTCWEARGRMVIEPGWTRIGTETEEDEDNAKAKERETDQALPAVSQGDEVCCTEVESRQKKTTPPSRFTEGTLIEAMANVHRFVSDPAAKATLKENEGIGTEATRASILETLKARKYLAPDKKALISTPLGRDIIDLTPDSLKNPVTTAQWESRLESIAAGREELASFMAEQVRVLPDLLAPILTSTPKLAASVAACPECGRAMRLRQGERGPWWACSGYPECRSSLPDDNGKPGQRQAPSLYRCPECSGLLKHFKTKKGTMCFACFADAQHNSGKTLFWNDHNGKPAF